MASFGDFCANTVATQEVLDFCSQVRPAAEKKALPFEFDVYEALWFRSQVVDGMNYVVKILVGPGAACVHVSIFQPLGGGNVKFQGIQTGKTVRDALKADF